MSKLANATSGDDHPEAAGKHLDDAFTLFVNERYDGAGYLAGYVVECSLKSVVLFSSPGPGTNWKKQDGHKLNTLSTKAVHLAVSLSAGRTARYVPNQTPGHSIYASATGWRETLRYRPSATVSDQAAAAWIEEAEKVYESTVAKMWKDGVL